MEKLFLIIFTNFYPNFDRRKLVTLTDGGTPWGGVWWSNQCNWWDQATRICGIGPAGHSHV